MDDYNVEKTPNLNLQHLQLALLRLDVLIHRQMQRMQAARPDTAAAPGYYISDDQAYMLLQRPFGQFEPVSGDEQTYQEALNQARQQMFDLEKVARRQGENLGLVRLAALFGLDAFEQDVLLIALAPIVDGRYEALYGYLQDDITRKQATVSLALDLLAPAGPERLTRLAYFAPKAALFRHHLLNPAADPSRPGLLQQPLAIYEEVVNWLLTLYRPGRDMAPFLKFERHPAGDDSWLPQPILAELARESKSQTNETALLAFHGPDDLARQTAGEWLSRISGYPFLSLDLAGLKQAEREIDQAISLALRDGLLTNAVVYLHGWDSYLTDDMPPPELLEKICRHPGRVIISSQQQWQARQVARTRPIRWFHFPTPDYAHRQQLLTHFLAFEQTPRATPANPAGADSPTKLAPQPSSHLPLAALAGQFNLSLSQLRDVAVTARDMALQSGRPVAGSDLFAAARAHSNPRLAALARKITPRYEWDDIILPTDQLNILRELVATVRARPIVLEQWGLGKKLVASAGVTVLFAGPPGTGKTMAAEVIARDLGLDLYKIDLSGLVSKYIGETEKNLERIFTEAASSNAILFFDEADAVFGKRSEVKDSNDRYANIEVSYLLQRMEAYNGITILATNLRSNLDEAFLRRLQFAIDFPFPDPPDRLRIWQTLFPAGVPRDPDIDWNFLSRRFKLAGGNIRNIIVGATYLAATNGQVVKMEHLLHAMRRELQKMGRLVDETVLKM